ncbi:MAG: GH3 auxin-responsive promoter family protein [Phycisphaeraceae bacterium]
MIPGLINRAWSASMRSAEKRYRRALRRPADAQRALLLALIAEHADTAFGRDHGFDQIDSIDAFQRRVPLGDYATHEPYIARVRRGERRVLTADPVTHLIPTSGSSGGRKLVPHTRALQAQFDDALGPWVRDLFRQFPGAAGGKAYWSVSPAIPSDEDSPVPIGFQDDTDYLGPLGRLCVRRILAVPSDVRHITDTDLFWRTTALHLLAARDLALISVWHPSYLDRLLDAIARHWADLLDALPPRDARRLRRTTPDAVREVWPRLSLVSVWADASAALAFDRLKARVPGVGFQAKGLLATEGWTTIPYRGEHPLAVNTHFFEFIDDTGEPRRCDELCVGQAYATALTTAGGLYRYRTGDRVRVTGRVGPTPTLRFVGRDSATSDLRGEKLHESHVTACLRRVFAQIGYRPIDQLLAPSDDCSPARYVLLLHALSPPPSETEDLIEQALCANPHYALARRLGQLDRVQLCWRTRAFRQLESNASAGMGAVKPPILMNQDALKHAAGKGLVCVVPERGDPANSVGEPRAGGRDR